MSTSQSILLVACNQRNLDLLSQVLIKNGYVTDTAKDLAAVERIVETAVQYDLAMVDIAGFSHDVWNYCEKIASKNIPLLVIAPQKGQHVQHESLARGARGVLYKPLVVKELLTTVNEMVAEA